MNYTRIIHIGTYVKANLIIGIHENDSCDHVNIQIILFLHFSVRREVGDTRPVLFIVFSYGDFSALYFP